VSDHAARRQLIVQMRSLRAEREQVRAALPAASVPALEAPRSSDNPEDLLEQADAARDNEDKVRRELRALEGRIAETREERAFDRRLNDFLGTSRCSTTRTAGCACRRPPPRPSPSGSQELLRHSHRRQPRRQEEGFTAGVPVSVGADSRQAKASVLPPRIPAW